MRAESAEAAKRALAEEWDRYVAEGAEPAEGFLRELARRREVEAEETAKLREEIEETRERLREARKNEAARGEMLRELHEKAEAVARAEAEADATEARAEKLREALPPMAAVVRPGPGPEPAAFFGDDVSASASAPNLEDVASAIARDLDESVRRVRRAMGGEPEPAHAPAPGGHERRTAPGLTFPSHPYTLVAPLVAPPLAPSNAGVGMTPAQHARFRQQMMTHLQLQQQQHYLREQITLRERREAAAAATRDAGIPPRFTYPSYAPMQERDLGGAPRDADEGRRVETRAVALAISREGRGERRRANATRRREGGIRRAGDERRERGETRPRPHRRAAAAAARSAVSSAHAAGALDARGCAGAFVATVRRRGAGAFAATGRRHGAAFGVGVRSAAKGDVRGRGRGEADGTHAAGIRV